MVWVRSSLVLVASLAVTVGCSPFGNSAFTCTSDVQCAGAGPVAKCEPGGACSFDDASCMSHRRYSDLSGPLAGTCVGVDHMFMDAAVDGKIYLDAPASGVVCYGAGFAHPCFASAPTSSLTINGQPINTDSAMCSTTVTNLGGACVIAAGDLTIAGAVNATGSKPLVLVAATTLTISGTLDVASHRGGQIGAGSIPPTDTTSCDPGTAPGTSGGGAGGSFGTAGASGGAGGGAAGTPGAIKPASLRGGCSGQDGNNGTFGMKGRGGGAVYLIAGTSITITGQINASGASGSAGKIGDGGGGGGGSGGLIALDAPSVTSTGVIFANGGGGAQGSGNSTTGADGKEPIGLAPSGGSGQISGNGGVGGSGGAEGAAPVAGATPGTPYGAGGGGGSVGIVKLFGAATIGGSGGVSPAPS